MREAIIHIPHSEYDKVGLGGIVSIFREAGIRDITELVCESDGCLIAVTVDEPVDESNLSTMEYLEWWERLRRETAGVVYLCKIALPTFDEDSHPLQNSGISSDEISVDDQGMDVSLVGSQDDIAREIDEYGEAGMNVLLQRIGDYGGPVNPLDALTDRQREILESAYELGYYEVPRGVSTADIAEEMGLDASTVAEHLQRAERNLIAVLLPTS